MNSLPMTDRLTIAADAPDLDLLRRFEPVVRFTQGEQFYPMDVERYVQACSLWTHSPEGKDEQVIAEGGLTLDRLVEPQTAPFGTVQFLRFVAPLSLTEGAQAIADRQKLARQTGAEFHAGQGRLARGGLLPRLFDAVFSATLLLRGRVPGATAAMAQLDYYRMQEADEKYVYHGRVVRQGGWTMLQYWFFYAYNSWRSGFRGVNDHESDWELVMVYLYEEDGLLAPEWAAYASHDFHGDDLRRRWDDREELQLIDGHPVVFAGAGSHASYFRPGEYQAEASLQLPYWANRIWQVANRFWTETLGQRGGGRSPLRIPFVDFARGDGLSIGPGEARDWSPVVISEATPWVSRYRGLWGLFARDPISGENAPAGPMYNRDGSPRGSWYDPLGFAGLDKVPAPPQEIEMLSQRCSALQHRQEELGVTIPEQETELYLRGVELAGMVGNPHLVKQHDALGKRVAELSADLRATRREQSQNEALLEALAHRLALRQAGEKDPPRMHIRQLAVPATPAQMRFNRWFEAWAAASLSLLVLGFAILFYLTPQYLWVGVAILLVVAIIIESVLRGSFISTTSTVAIVLALIASVVLLVNFWQHVLVLGLAVAAVYLLVQKVRELRS